MGVLQLTKQQLLSLLLALVFFYELMKLKNNVNFQKIATTNVLS